MKRLVIRTTTARFTPRGRYILKCVSSEVESNEVVESIASEDVRDGNGNTVEDTSPLMKSITIRKHIKSE